MIKYEKYINSIIKTKAFCLIINLRQHDRQLASCYKLLDFINEKGIQLNIQII